MNIKIVIATHKAYAMPDDILYFPLHVGKEISSLSLPFHGDNTGEHISHKNPHYCELTALYWAWKNLNADYIGLAHYRRHYCTRKPFLSKNKFASVLTYTEAESLLTRTDIVLPKKRNYYIETNYTHYVHAHGAESLDKTQDIIRTLYPDYIPAFDSVMNATKAHMFNMFIMKKERFCSYCEWLFSILFELEKELGCTKENERIYGFVSELLLDVYLTKNNLDYLETDYMFMENEHWLKKGFAFLKRKFIH